MDSAAMDPRAVMRLAAECREAQVKSERAETTKKHTTVVQELCLLEQETAALWARGSHLNARQEKICKEFNDMQIALKFMRTKHDQAVQKLKDLKKEDAALRKQMGIPEEMSYQAELEELQRRAARLFADIEGGGLRAETTRGLGGRQGVADNRAPRAHTGTAAPPGPALNQDPRQGSPTEQGTGMTTRNAMARGNRGLGDGSNGQREGNQGRGQENAGPLQDTTAIAGGPVTGRKNNGAPASRERERSRERAPDGQVFLVVFSDDPNERVIGVLFLGAEGDVTAAFFCDCRVCVKSNSGCRCRICVLKERFAREVPNEKDLKGERCRLSYDAFATSSFRRPYLDRKSVYEKVR